MRAKGNTQAAKKGKPGRRKVAAPMKRVNICIDPADYDAVVKLAAANGMPSAMLIRLAVKELLESRNRSGTLIALRGTAT